jgi:hypothetical protein
VGGREGKHLQPDDTFLFRTAAGSFGILQYGEFRENPPRVRFRYKLLRTNRPVSTRQPTAAVGSAVLAAAFGPEKEVTLTEFNNMDGQKGLDLDTGTVFKQPKDMDQWSEEGLVQWVEENGVDLLVDHGPGGVWGLLTTTNAELKLAGVENDQWGAISAGGLVRVLAGGPTALQSTTLARVKVYIPPKGVQPPMTFAFKTSRGGSGVLQVTGYTDNPRGVKIRYKLVQARPAASTGSGKPEDSQRKFVRLVVDKAAMTFEGQPTTWDDVGALLEKVPERKNTVLECAVTSDQITVQQQNEWFGKCIALAHGLSFEYSIFIGIHALGSKGTTPSAVPTEAEPLSGTLPDGVKIQLVGLTDYPTMGKPSWRPDGRPLPAPLFDQREVDVRSLQLRDERVVELALSVTGLKAGKVHEDKLTPKEEEQWLAVTGLKKLEGYDVPLSLPHRSFWAGRKFKNGAVEPSVVAVGIIIPANTTVAHITVSLGANGRLGIACEMFPSAAAAAEGSPPLPREGGPGIAFKNVSFQTSYTTRPEVQTAH